MRGYPTLRATKYSSFLDQDGNAVRNGAMAKRRGRKQQRGWEPETVANPWRLGYGLDGAKRTDCGAAERGV
jgi:hypothetical protein